MRLAPVSCCLILRSSASAANPRSIALRSTIERALAALTDERKIKQQLTGAKRNVEGAYGLVEAMAERVRAYLEEIDALVRPADAEPAEAPTDDQLAL